MRDKAESHPIHTWRADVTDAGDIRLSGYRRIEMAVGEHFSTAVAARYLPPGDRPLAQGVGRLWVLDADTGRVAADAAARLKCVDVTAGGC